MIPVKLDLDPARAFRVISGVIALTVVVLILVRLYHRGYAAGAASKQAEVIKIEGRLTTANTQIAVLAQRLEVQNASIEDARRKAVEARDAAKVAESVADATKAAADAEASAWQKKLDAAAKTPQCAVLTMPLCDDVADY